MVLLFAISFFILADVNCIKMPPTIRKRGRPKGLEKTVIGLDRQFIVSNCVL